MFKKNVLMLSRLHFLLLNITNPLVVMFVILQNKKNFPFLSVHLNLNSEVVEILENFIVFVQTPFETAIKVIKNDNETEFFMTGFFVNKEIVHQTSYVNTVECEVMTNWVGRTRHHVLVLTATCSSDLIPILRGGPYSVVTQLRDNPSCKSSFLKVPLTQGVTFWVRTHASQPLVTRPGSVSTFLSYHAHGSPLGVALSWVVSVPGVSQRWRGYFHKSGYSSLVLGIWP